MHKILIATHIDIPRQFGKSLKKPLIHRPVRQIARRALELAAERKAVALRVEGEDILVGVRPVEAQVLAKAVAELGVGRVAVVREDEMVA